MTAGLGDMPDPQRPRGPPEMRGTLTMLAFALTVLLPRNREIEGFLTFGQ
jgi:hypothetical protein